MKGFFAVFAVLAALAGCTEQTDETLPVYLLLGQSNMVGMRSIATDLPADMQGTEPLALFFKDGKWIPLAPGVSEPKGFGPEISFSHELAANGGKFGLIKVSAGATTLASEWAPSNKDGLYVKTIAQVDAAKKTRNIKVAGVLWMQGESDGATAEMAAAYKSNLERLISAIRHDTGVSSLPFSVCRITSPASQFPFTEQVRKAQESVSVSGYGWFDCDSLSKGPDSLHYDTAGQINLGKLFYKTLNTL